MAGKGGGQCFSHMHILCNSFLKTTVGGINYCCQCIDKHIKVTNLAKALGPGSQKDLNSGPSAPELLCTSLTTRGALPWACQRAAGCWGKGRWRSCGGLSPGGGGVSVETLSQQRDTPDVVFLVPEVRVDTEVDIEDSQPHVGLWGESPQCQPNL